MGGNTGLIKIFDRFACGLSYLSADNANGTFRPVILGVEQRIALHVYYQVVCRTHIDLASNHRDSRAMATSGFVWLCQQQQLLSTRRASDKLLLLFRKCKARSLLRC